MSKQEKTVDIIEKQIIAAISQIKQGKLTPKDSNMGSLLKRLKPLDEALYEKFIKEYKIVFEQWKKG